jgi:putative transposase
LGGILRNNNARLLAAGGMPDHVHLYVSLPSTITVAKVVNLLKSNSTTWVKQNIENMDRFHWQEKHGAFSVSKSGEKTLCQHIANQQEHHRQRTFKEEFLALLERREIDFDERYLWD